MIVIPAKAGIQRRMSMRRMTHMLAIARVLDSGLRRNDENMLLIKVQFR